ncbi:MAG: N-acetylmuramoyl-L-alanine amidase [Cyclobacteriaceae bacterium]
MANSYFSLILSFFSLLSLAACSGSEQPQASSSSLAGKTIFLDPGHGGTADTDQYRVGPTGEREEWINLRVGLILRDMLVEKGARVLMSRTADSAVALQDRAETAKAAQADVFLSIHHNATADTSVNFPIIYYHGNASENKASVRLASLLAVQLQKQLFDGNTPVSIVSDHVIFPTSGTAVLRHSYGIPGVIGEATFFTHAPEELRLKDENYNRREAAAYLAALEAFFAQEIPPVKEKYSQHKLPPFLVFQEAERMKPEALLWLQDYQSGKKLLQEGKTDSAYQHLTRSARSFPDSYVAREVHLLRADALEQMDSTAAATEARLRAKEYFVDLQ